ncbi:hypothetical protein KXV92_000350, partial [Aspergillus fumigatus]
MRSAAPYDDNVQLARKTTFLPSPRDTHRTDTGVPNWTNGSYSPYNPKSLVHSGA